MTEPPKEQRRHEQLTALDQLKREMRCFCRGLLPFTIQQLLVAWFMDDDATTNGINVEGGSSEIIFEQIQQLRRKFERQEPLVQLELVLWKNACLVNIPEETTQSPFNYLLRGGWKNNKRSNRHDAMIGTVIQHVLPFLPPEYFTQDVVRSVTVSKAGFEKVNGTYEKSPNEDHKFTKSGVYEGDAVTYILRKEVFSLNACTRSNWLLFIEEQSDPPHVINREFYCSSLIRNTTEEIVPPAQNWLVSGLGREPAPLVCAEIVPHYKMPPT